MTERKKNIYIYKCQNGRNYKFENGQENTSHSPRSVSICLHMPTSWPRSSSVAFLSKGRTLKGIHVSVCTYPCILQEHFRFYIQYGKVRTRKKLKTKISKKRKHNDIITITLLEMSLQEKPVKIRSQNSSKGSREKGERKTKESNLN